MDDIALKEVGKIRTLRGLMIQSTSITDEGIKQILDLPELDFLRIGDNRLTDASLKRIAMSLPKLTTLYLHRLDGVTDEGLLALGNHPKLQYVHISRGQFSSAAIEKLRAVREGLRVIE